MLGDRIKAVRQQLGLNQLEFGERIGVSDATISMYESERRTPKKQSLQLICEKFGVNPEWLTDGVGEMFDNANPNLLERIAKEYRLTDLEKNIVKIYLELPAPQKESIAAFLRDVASLAAKSDLDPVLHAVPKIQLRPSAREGTDITAVITPEQEKSYGERLSELPKDSDF